MLKEKEEIEGWLKKHFIRNYTLIEDKEYGYVINIDGNVNLKNHNLKKIDVKFNIINGNFDCSFNKLISLVGCPKIVYHNFDCSDNNLKSLIGCSEIVNGYFACSYNQLKTLEFVPKIIKKHFYCSNNLLTFNNLNKLFDIDLKNNCIFLNGNLELGELQKINDFNELKQILTICQEKADFMKILEVTDKSVVEKINKI